RLQNQLPLAGGAARVERRRHRHLRRSEFGGNRHAWGHRRPEPIYLTKQQSILGQSHSGADDDAAPFGIDAQYVKRVGTGYPESLSLADRKMRDAAMSAEHAPCAIHDLAGLSGLRV